MPRGRGRPPKDSTWNEALGRYVSNVPVPVPAHPDVPGDVGADVPAIPDDDEIQPAQERNEGEDDEDDEGDEGEDDEDDEGEDDEDDEDDEGEDDKEPVAEVAKTPRQDERIRRDMLGFLEGLGYSRNDICDHPMNKYKLTYGDMYALSMNHTFGVPTENGQHLNGIWYSEAVRQYYFPKLPDQPDCPGCGVEYRGDEKRRKYLHSKICPLRTASNKLKKHLLTCYFKGIEPEIINWKERRDEWLENENVEQQNPYGLTVKELCLVWLKGAYNDSKRKSYIWYSDEFREHYLENKKFPRNKEARVCPFCRAQYKSALHKSFYTHNKDLCPLANGSWDERHERFQKFITYDKVVDLRAKIAKLEKELEDTKRELRDEELARQVAAQLNVG